MKIIIIGGGKVGFTIAAQLTKEGHDITVVDHNDAVVAQIGDALDCMTICGSGASLDVLRAAGAEHSDLLIACTMQDELNMLCCVFAKKLGIRSAIARVRSPEYARQLYLVRDELGLSLTINPEFAAAREIFRQMEIPGIYKRDSFAKGRIEIIELEPKAGDALDGARLMDLPKKIHNRFLIVAVQRGGETVIPDGSFTLRTGDKVYLCAATTDVVSILRDLNESQRKARNVLLIGGSRIAEYLTVMLEEAGTGVKLIEIAEETARSFAERFPKCEVVCADGTSAAVLKEEGMEAMDAVAMLTNVDEENLILAMYAASRGVGQVLAKVDHTAFGSLVSDKTCRLISPKDLCADTIVRYVRAMHSSGAGSVIARHPLANGQANALEFSVTEACRHRGETLAQLRLKPNILIASIHRMGKVILPRGGDMLEAGDTVLVVTTSNRVILDLNDIFAEEP